MRADVDGRPIRRSPHDGTCVDARGWVTYSDDMTWSIPRLDMPCPLRRGLPWSPAEDHALLRRTRQLAEDPCVRDAAGVLAKEHQRTTCSIAMRLNSLRVGLRLAAIGKLAEGIGHG